MMRSSQLWETLEKECPTWKGQQVQRHQGHAGRSEKGLCVCKVVGEEKEVGRKLERCPTTGIFILITASALARQT